MLTKILMAALGVLLLLGSSGIAAAAPPADLAPDLAGEGSTSAGAPAEQTEPPGIAFSFDSLLEAIDANSEDLTEQLKEARQAALDARLAKAAATQMSVFAAQVAESAAASARTAQVARAKAIVAQDAVNRWAAAAYRGNSLSLLAATITASSSPADYLHTSGLTLHAADYQAYLVETAHNAATAASLAEADAVAAARRAETAVTAALSRAEEAERMLQEARIQVDLAEKKLRSSKLKVARLLPGMSLERALGIAREWGDGRLAGLLEQASILKDNRPFVPGSGANSTERLPEWERWDPTVVPGTPRAYAVFRLAHFGWSVLEWPCLDRMWWHESGWSIKSTDAMQGTGYGELNPNLTWGIPQANPASKMADPAQGGGPDWVTNPMTQINWGLTYIKRIYGSPCGAWDAWRARAATGSYGWY